MKPLKKALLVLTLVALALPGTAWAQPKAKDFGGDSSSGAGGCLNALNNCQNNCDALSGNTRVGCLVDCTYNYYFCLAATAFN